jgi:hypothetical protein
VRTTLGLGCPEFNLGIEATVAAAQTGEETNEEDQMAHTAGAASIGAQSVLMIITACLP